MGIFLKRLPLAKQQKLRQANLIDLAGELSSGTGQGGRIASDQLGRPIEVRYAAILDFQRPEQRVIVQPVRLLIAELLEGGLQVPARRRRQS